VNQPANNIEAEFDADAWRGVLFGLTMLVLGWVHVPVLVFPFLLVALAGPAWIALVVFGGLAYVGFGIAHCCCVPADSGARVPLIITGLLLLNAVLFIIAYLIWLFPVDWQTWVGFVLASVIGVSLVLAQLGWLLFLRAVAVALADAKLSRTVRNYALVFSIWAGMNLAAVWTGRVTGHNPLGSVLTIFNVGLLCGHYFGIMAVSEQTRKRIEEQLQTQVRLKRRPLGADEMMPLNHGSLPPGF
jgi:hypothetical protein